MPENRLKAFHADDLELVVEWWLHEAVRGGYQHVVPYGGTGDMGRDIAGFVGAVGSDPWDNFQCKQYGKKLGPGDVAAEMCKLVVYVTRGQYSNPRRYTFVAPMGLTSQALNLLADPEKLRKRLLEKWAESGGEALCPLAEIRGAIEAFTFPEFASVGAGQIVADLRDTPSFPYFFGGGLTIPRPPDKTPPEDIAEHELPYIGELLRAYDEHAEVAIATAPEALAHEPYGSDLKGSRQDFYCAESLREFSRDAFPDMETFLDLQTIVHDGIRFTVARAHPTGYDRSLAVREHVTAVQLGDHPLAGEVNPADRSGICHQLVNDGKFSWCDG